MGRFQRHGARTETLSSLANIDWFIRALRVRMVATRVAVWSAVRCRDDRFRGYISDGAMRGIDTRGEPTCYTGAVRLLFVLAGHGPGTAQLVDPPEPALV